ncbi:MAG: hypothetical protein HOH04_11430 [Rhodospirillaceae bacterium]|jgi:hypothetical protein|nr:hypothetical protein [Rhodospirillaceae bacterium]
MTKSLRVAGALAAPLLLGACGLPVGIQIASLVADGVSYMTTDKTLTDHGISAVTQKDCALWRTVEGKDICRNDADSDIVQTALADTESVDASDDLPEQVALAAGGENNTNVPTGQKTDDLLSEKRVVVPAPVKPATTPATTNEPLKPLDTDKMILGAPETIPETIPEIIPEATPSRAPIQTATLIAKRAEAPAVAPMALTPIAVAKVETPSRTEKMVARNVVPTPPTQTRAVPAPALLARTVSAKASDTQASEAGPKQNRTYYIIASYHRQADAERFSGRHTSFNPLVLEGRAKGRRVFRVAVGPIALTARTTTRTELREAGFNDTWKLSLKAPKVVTELASLN